MMITTTNYTYAWVISSSISLSWITNPSSTWTGSNAWKIVFPNNTDGVKVDASGLNTNSLTWITITWDFWLSETSSSSSWSLWYATFDTWLSNKVILVNNWNNTFTFSWIAWSNAAWEIYFTKTNSVVWDDSTKVVYDRTNNKVSWCAWSVNLWWICLNDFKLDTTPIDLTISPWTDLLKTQIANDSIKLLTFPSYPTANWASRIVIDNWNSLTLKSTYDIPFNIQNHDMRAAKDYNITIYDENWSYSTSFIKIVAWAPAINADPNKITPWATASIFTGTTNISKVANNDQAHNIDFKLRDKYGNPVITVPWIKTVKVTLKFSNNVDKDQILDLNTWDAIKYNPTWLSSSLTDKNLFTWSTSSWDYKMDIKSLAPTKAWYSETTLNNDISLNNLTVEVSAFPWYTNVWAWTNSNLFPITDTRFSTIKNNLKFTPPVYVSDLTNSSDANKSKWKILRDVPTTFTWIITFDNPTNVSNISITHKLNTTNSTWDSDSFIRFKVDASRSNWTPFSTWDTNSWTNIKNKYTWSLSSGYKYDTFTVTPKIISAWAPNFWVKYSSNVAYDMSWENILYPSYKYNPTSNNLVNNQLKVAWLVNNASTQTNSKVVIDDKTSYIWKVDKPTVIANIKKNIVKYQRVWKWTDWVLYINWVTKKLSELTLLTDTNTIIVDWWDLIIDQNINSWTLKALIALKWNIIITKNVQKIYATLVTDRSVLSWDSTRFYTPNEAQDQLFIKWSVLSYNTIWWSSSATPKCPFYVTTTCTQSEALKYDFNNFRYYINWDGTPWSRQWIPVSWISSNYDNSPMIVEYDSTLQTNPPKVFLNN